MLRTLTVTRYVTPLREGGSLPAIVEADDNGLYVLKFRGAGQGLKALIAELVAGEIARALGLRVPEIVFANLDTILSRTEPDPEIQGEISEDLILGTFRCDPARFTVTVKDGIVTIAGTPETTQVGLDIIDAARHMEGVVAVRYRLTYPVK